jgi:hypothetical protein
MVPLWALITFIVINSLGKYTEVGDITLFVLIMFFAIWAWWYGEDRDRRRARGESAQHTDPGSSSDDGG